MDLIDVHEEILHRIFDYLDHKTLLSLMEVCKKFYILIAGSLKMCRNFRFSLKGENLELKHDREELENCNRIFPFVALANISSSSQSKFNSILIYFEKMGKYIENLGISNCYFDPVAFAKMLELVPNINTIKICYTNFSRTKIETIVVSNKFSCLRRLHVSSYTAPYSGQPDILATLFRNASQLNRFFIASEKIDSWSDFLQNQTKLEVLEMQSDILPSLHNQVKFQLRELSCSLSVNPIEIAKNFKDFIRTQSRIMKLKLTISLEDDDTLWTEYNQVLSYLLSLRSLRNLTLLRNDSYQSISSFPYIKHSNLRHLTMEIKDISDYMVLRNYPDLKGLNISFCNRNVDVEKVVKEINRLEHLRELYIRELKAKYFSVIEIPNLRKFSIHMYGSTIYPKTWKKFLDNNPSLEQLELLYITGMTTEIFNTITQSAQNLKYLKIIHFFEVKHLTDQIFNLILKNCRNMKQLELYALCNEEFSTEAVRYLNEYLPDLKCRIYYSNENGSVC